jgi:UDP-GlcNAc3NAcA epimerase
MKILTVVGARPQFVKAAVISHKLRQNNINEFLIHTGQHYDSNMSDIFFDELNISKPNVNLGIGSGNHGAQTGEMIKRIEDHIIKENPDYVFVYGDTNSTLAAAIACVKLPNKLVHIEAGLRSFNKLMPEEHNRILTDHSSDLLLCPNKLAKENLKKEGMTSGVYIVGDVMFDACKFFIKSYNIENLKKKFEWIKNKFIIATIHRPVNTDNIKNLKSIIGALNESKNEFVIPLHPRTEKIIKDYKSSGISGLDFNKNVRIIKPVSYIEMINLISHAEAILTDSGGIQKEAAWLNTKCITMRDETEWTWTLENERNVLVGASKEKILNEIDRLQKKSFSVGIEEEMNASEEIINIINLNE